ncbi:MAG: EAL domain-containing protein [Thermoanaerobaculia bacterium]|nr:EAL domain-containing protein [Thermoanaerobaculia bacterium]
MTTHPRDTDARPERLEVLLIEDSPDDARQVEGHLALTSNPRFSLTVCPNLADGLGALERRDFDVALVDLSLPDSGSDPLDSFRQVHRMRADLPVVVLTGMDDDEVARRAVQAGAMDFLFKDEVQPSLLGRSLQYAVERMRSERRLRESEERYALAVEGAHDGIWDWDLDRNRIYLSPRWKAIVGHDDDEIDDRPEEWFERVHPADLARLESEIRAHAEGGSSHFEIEHRIRHKDGGYRWVLSRGVAVRDRHERTYRMAGSLTDVTRRKAAEEQLLHDALHDALTGLPNRALLLDRLGITLAQAHRAAQSGSPVSFCLLFLDLDRFKNINDSLGHAEGDQLLLAMAHRLTALVRPGDTVARLGGDEFTILMPCHDPSIAEAVAGRTLAALEVPFDVNGRDVYVTGSIGIAIGPGEYHTPEEILRDADTAMYRAKTEGRARYVIFDREMHHDVLTMLQLETDLRRAVDRRELHLHYQPIISLRTGRLCGFEALLRWNHAERGPVYPAEIIPLAEESDLIGRISEWAIRESCNQLAEWREEHPDLDLTMSINLSNKQFQQPGVVEMVASSIEASGIQPNHLRLELTESAIMDSAGSARLRLQRLRDLGVGLDIDDFGTGYSSLSYLHRLPIDTLKIDRSFVSGIDRNGRESRQIVSLIVDLARHLGLSVAAEGLETSEQLETIRELDCEFGQGFFLARPMDKHAAAELLRIDRVW